MEPDQNRFLSNLLMRLYLSDNVQIGSGLILDFTTNSINPPEVQGQVVRLLIYGKVNCDAKVSKSPIWVNNKIAEIVIYQNRARAHSKG